MLYYIIICLGVSWGYTVSSAKLRELLPVRIAKNTSMIVGISLGCILGMAPLIYPEERPWKCMSHVARNTAFGLLAMTWRLRKALEKHLERTSKGLRKASERSGFHGRRLWIATTSRRRWPEREGLGASLKG